VPPQLGEHTAAILHEVLEMSDDDIASAREHGAFGQASPVHVA
jgi:hypothetical protein